VLFLGGRPLLLQPLFKFGEALEQFAFALVFLRLPPHFLRAAWTNRLLPDDPETTFYVNCGR
jgi:hypothetical protein